MTIVYKDNEGYHVITPAPNWDIQIVADKDVPAGLGYKFVENDQIPAKENRADWVLEISQSTRDGVGLSKSEFIQKYPNYKNYAVVE